MKKLFVIVLLASVVACASKKANTTPTNPEPAPEEKSGDPTGGATYGGAAAAPADPGTPNPCSGK
jgi:hypothetical protein